jgi:hypothetical protein
MILIRHCIVDKNTNTVVNIIEYDTIQTNVPPGLDLNLFCVQSDTGQIGGIYADGVITNPIVIQNILADVPTPLAAT